MNWGWKIVILYTAFVVIMLTMVYKCTQQNIDLVTEDYYAKEVNFEEHYLRLQNSNDASMRMIMEFNPESKELSMVFSEKALDKKLSGEIIFFRPDDKTLDRTLAVNVQEHLTQKIQCKDLKRGLWKVQVNWNMDELKLYKEERIFIP